MSFPSAISRLSLSTLLILLGAACSDSPPGDPIVRVGQLNVSIVLTGGDTDDNGFVLIVGSGASRRWVPVATAVLFRFAVGTHSLLLDGISPNCSVNGDNPQNVVVSEGGTTDVSFALSCEPTGISVTTRTTGFNMPLSYDLMVADKLLGMSVPANGSAVVSRLSPGVHAVTLAAGDNCTIAGGKRVTVNVVNRVLTPVTFEVDCGAVIRTDKIAYTSSGDSWHTISVAHPDGTSPTPLSDGHSPAWSRDGTRLLFSKMECIYDQSYNDEMCSGSLATIDPETRALTIVPNSVAATAPAWSPVTDEIVFVRCCSQADWGRLYLMRMDGPAAGSPAVQIVFQPADFVPSHVGSPTWSPDGQRIAFTCYAPGVTAICVVNRDGSGLVRLTTERGAHSAPAWSPDGRAIAFTSWIPASSGTGSESVVNVIEAEGGSITTLAAGSNPAWSRDGKQLIFDRKRVLHTMDADGTNVTKLQVTNGHDASWRP